jgi:hypothetical protein
MHQGTRIVLDERLNAEGSLTLYTSLEHTDFLSDADQLGFQAIFSASTFATSGTLNLSVQIQHSADGRNWLNANTTPELSQTITLMPVQGQWSLIGGESWPARPRLRFVMLVITIKTLNASPPSSRLQLFATARSRLWSPDDTERAVAPPHLAPVTRREAMGRLLGMRPSTFEEVEMHMRAVQPGDHPSQMINRLSPGARADLERVTSNLRNLPPEQKHAALTFTSALASMLMLPPERSATPEPISAPSTRQA